ncbi:hypothetical protein [Aliagarivorans taiwanensis]|uniref:hypothetical protein n=1 Tax=Aliagarivorans taiwanensis TaxID=561966 RepID=UPI0012F99990|nr:hypothetical protein [Aliagarivorans taiwanensis]
MNNFVVLLNQLRETFSAREAATLEGTAGLKIGSYMMLVDYWRQHSLREVLQPRGIELTATALNDAGIAPALVDLPMYQFAGLPLAVDALRQCQKPNNLASDYHQIDLLTTLTRLRRVVDDHVYNAAGKAALLILYFDAYSRLHLPTTTHTFADNQCVSDLHAQLSCASDWLVEFGIDQATEEYLLRSQRRMEELTNVRPVVRQTAAGVISCPLSISTFLANMAGLGPTTMQGIVSSSQALLIRQGSHLLSLSEHTEVSRVVKENAALIELVYFPTQFYQRHPGMDPARHVVRIENQYFYRVQLAALRLVNLLNEEPLLNDITSSAN